MTQHTVTQLETLFRCSVHLVEVSKDFEPLVTKGYTSITVPFASLNENDASIQNILTHYNSNADVSVYLRPDVGYATILYQRADDYEVPELSKQATRYHETATLLENQRFQEQLESEAMATRVPDSVQAVTLYDVLYIVAQQGNLMPVNFKVKIVSKDCIQAIQ